MTKASASAMISKAVELSSLPHDVLAHLRDEELLFVLEGARANPKVLGAPIENPGPVGELVRKLRQRSLHVPVYVISRASAGAKRKIEPLVANFYAPDKMDLRRDVEAKIAKAAGIDPHQVIIYCPAKEMSTKAAMVQVLWPKETAPCSLQELCEKGQGIDDENTRMEIQQLKKKHEALWQLTVFVDAECTHSQRVDVAAQCEAASEFYEIPNDYAEFAVSPNEVLFNRNLATAIQQLPEGTPVNVDPVRELMTSDYHGGKRVPSVAQMKAAMMTQTSGEKSPALFPDVEEAGQSNGKAGTEAS